MSSDPPASVVVVEDSLVAREGLVAIARSLPSVGDVATATTPDAALREVADGHADLVITDIRMPPAYHDEGIALAETLAETHPEMPVIVLSQFCEPTLAARLLDHHTAGRGYLLKDRLADPAVLADAIATVREGGTAIDPSLVAGMVVDGRGRSDIPIAGLTPRESEVISLVAAGMSNGAIAREIGISRKGVEKNISQIFAKLGLGADGDVSPRVTATLMWLESRGST